MMGGNEAFVNNLDAMFTEPLGKTFWIEARNTSKINKYIQSATLNGESLNKPLISHEATMNNGKLIFEMGPKANKVWGNE